MSLIMQSKTKLLGYDQIEFCEHALSQMKMRGITATQVMKALSSPSETGLPTQMFRSRIRKDISRKKALDVVYEELTDRIRVVTAFIKEFK